MKRKPSIGASGAFGIFMVFSLIFSSHKNETISSFLVLQSSFLLEEHVDIFFCNLTCQVIPNWSQKL